MRMLISGILVMGTCLVLLLPACSKKGEAASDANHSSTTTQAAAPAVPPKPYLAPAEIYEAVAPEYAPCRQNVGEGIVDWSRGVIVASGSAKAPSAAPQERIKAQRAAEQTAIRNAVLAANGITVDSRGKFSDLCEGTVEFQGTVAGREVLASEWDAPSLTASATVSIPMYSPSHGFGISMAPICLVTIRPWSQEDDAEVDVKKANWAPPRRAWNFARKSKESEDLILVDARGCGVTPCLLPRILDEKGRRLFDPRRDLDFENSTHIAIYVCAKPGGTSAPSGTSASGPGGRAQGEVMGERIVLKPRTVSGQGTGGGINDIVLSETEIAKLEAHADSLALLKAGRLVIIVDHTSGAP